MARRVHCHRESPDPKTSRVGENTRSIIKIMIKVFSRIGEVFRSGDSRWQCNGRAKIRRAG